MKQSNVIQLRKLEERVSDTIDEMSIFDESDEVIQVFIDLASEPEAVIYFTSLIDKTWKKDVGPDPFILEKLRGKVDDEFVRKCYNHIRNHAFRDEVSKEVRLRAGVLLDNGELPPVVAPGYILRENGCINDLESVHRDAI